MIILDAVSNKDHRKKMYEALLAYKQNMSFDIYITFQTFTRLEVDRIIPPLSPQSSLLFWLFAHINPPETEWG